MSLGIFANARRSSISGIGALGATSIIPGECWSQPNFKTCHGVAYANAVSHCDQMGARGSQRDACIVSKADTDALRGCGCRLTSSSSAAATAPTLLPWRSSTPDSRVSSLQRAVNASLAGKGYTALTVDGKLGPGTCGAARLSDRQFNTAFMQQYRLTDVCQSYTEPVKAGGGFPSAAPTTLEPAPQASTASLVGGFNMKTLLLIGAVGVGAVLLLSGDKNESKKKE